MDSNARGLTSAEAAAARAQYGENVLTPPPRDPWWVLFREKFDDPVIRILMIAAFISIAVGLTNGHYIEGIGIIIAILLATGLAFINEFRANKEFDVLNQTTDEAKVKVIRDGQHTLVARREVVVGDLVELNQGDEIPADGAIVAATALEVNESAFTGESLPARKTLEATEAGTYAANRLLRSTMVVDGSGAMRVETVGDATEIGKTARLASEDTGEQSPLNAQLERLSKWIGVIGFAIAAGTFGALIARGILKGEIQLSQAQAIATSAAGIGIGILLAPIWLPLIYDFFELRGQEKEPPAWLEAGWKTWAGLLLVGLVVFGVLIGIAIAARLVPSNPANWFNPEASQRFLEFFMIAVTIIVVAVPEGLAMSVTLSLAYSMRRMTATNCLVRRMDACETIGAATHICSDKTGTLTMNQMRVQEGYFGHNQAERATSPNWHSMAEAPGLIYEAIAVNSTANLGAGSAATLAKGQREPNSTFNATGDNPAQTGSPEVIGNPTEGALLLWMNAQGQNYEAARGSFQTIRQWPFSTERKFMATVGTSPRSGQVLAHFKGAPDIILARCTHYISESGPRPIEEQRPAIEAALVNCQSRAMRTLGFAVRTAEGVGEDADLDQLAQGLTWLGFAAIADPIRPEVPAAIERCRRAGIDVKIVTGDNPLTAREIARQIGLWDENVNGVHANGTNGTSAVNGAPSTYSTSGAPIEGDGQVILGSDFAALSDEEARDAAGRIKVMARARPADKLRLVDSLQKRGAVVAVTGDGTNDAPALNYAQVGLAMGQAGTAVAKEASDIIILDDSFGSIATAVKWGRSLYLNIQKFILFQLTINVVACGIALLGPFIGVELPLTVMQMLWVNLIMDTFAALALATEPPEEKVMDQKPRGPHDFIVSPEMMRKIFTVGGIFIVLMILAIKLPVFGEQSISEIEANAGLEHAQQAAKIGGNAAMEGGQGHAQRGAPSTQLTAFFTFFVLLQFWNMFNARTLGSNKSAFAGIKENPYFLVIAALILFGQILIVTFGGTFFRVMPLSIDMWIKLLASTSLVLIIGEVLRALDRARNGRTSKGNTSEAAPRAVRA